MEKSTKQLILRRMIENSVMRNENMKLGIIMGIVTFQDYQDRVENLVKREVKIINHLTERQHDNRK